MVEIGQAKVEKFEFLAQKFGIPDLEPLRKKYGFDIR